MTTTATTTTTTTANSTGNAILSAALGYAARGWRVLPLHSVHNGACTCGKPDCSSPGKHPRTEHGLKDASIDASIVREWWARWPDANVGILTGAASGIIVVDVDQRHGGDVALDELLAVHGPLPEAPEVHTGGGGRHYYFAHPGGHVKGDNRGKVGVGLDIKAEGGYVVAPPSLHASGKEYVWEYSSDPSTMPLAPPPAWVLDKLKGPQSPAVAKIAAAPVGDTIPFGQRDSTLISIAGSMRQRGLRGPEILSALREVNRRCSPPLTEADLTKIAKSVGRYAPGALATTDLGNAARFVALAGDDLRYCGARGKWLAWDGRRWRVDDDLRVVREAKRVALSIFDEAKKAPNEDRQKALAKWAVQSQKRDRLAAMVDLARCELPVSPAELDADPWLFNCENAVVDLRNGEPREHRPEDLMTKLSPVRFDPAAECPLYDAFLDRIMAGNRALIRYLDKILGMSLTGDVGEQVLIVFYGPGANGKSVCLDTWTGLLGDYAAEAAPSLLIDRHTPEHPTELADLCGKRLVVSCESEEGGRLKVQLVKRLTGNATLKARFMRQDYFEFKRTHKLILATNNRPVIREASLAIWRRIRLIPFAVTIPPQEQDKALLAKLRAEWPGIFARAVRGCLAWQAEGLQAPPEVEAATEDYRSEQDPTTEFLAATYILAPNAFTPRTDLFNAYQAWATANHERYPLGRNDLYARIRLRPGIEERPKRVGTSVLKGFWGLGLLAANPQEVPNGLL